MARNPYDSDEPTQRITGASKGSETPAPSHGNNALETGTRIGEFEILGLVGEGGFGIVYLAHDHSLGRRVALKEYMPSDLAHRMGDTAVAVRSQRHAETFAAGLRSFINEARMLAQFDHPSLVKVYRFWEQNGTAYMVMPFYKGLTLKQTLGQRGRAPDEAWLRTLLTQLLDALEVIHSTQTYHRDIAPDNILMLAGDVPLLLDFGAARRVIGDMTQALTVILKPGYAPIEQYAEVPNMKQGPWTDLYALASVVYFAIVGKAPAPAVARVMADPLVPLSEAAAGRYSSEFLAAIDAALAVRPEDRPQDIGEFRRLLGSTPQALYTGRRQEISIGAPLQYDDADEITRRLTSALPLPMPTSMRGEAPLRAPAISTAAPPSDARDATRRNVYVIVGIAAAALVLAGYLLFILFDDPLGPDAHSTKSAMKGAPPAAVAPAPAPRPESDPNLASPACAPYCTVAGALAPYVIAGGSAPSIALRGGGSSAREGERLIAEINGPTFDGFLYIDLYDPEGNVVHLLPNPQERKNRIGANRQTVIGDDPFFGQTWDIVPPFGKHMLVVMASRTTLFDRERPQVENVEGYLRAVREAAGRKMADDHLAAYYTIVEFIPRR